MDPENDAEDSRLYQLQKNDRQGNYKCQQDRTDTIPRAMEWCPYDQVVAPQVAGLPLIAVVILIP